MAAFDAVTEIGTGTGTSVNGNHTPVGTPTDALVALITLAAVSSISITYGGNATTLVNSTGANGIYVYVYKLTGPPSGAQNVAASWTGSVGYKLVAVTTTGTAGVDASAVATGGGGAGQTITVNVASASGRIVIDLVGGNAYLGTPTVGANQTSRLASMATTPKALVSNEAGAATVTMSWTTTQTGENQYWATVAVSLLELANITVTPSPATAVAASVNPTFKYTFTPSSATAIAASVNPTFKYAVTPTAASAVAVSVFGGFPIRILLHFRVRDTSLIYNQRDTTLIYKPRDTHLTYEERDD